MATSASDRVDDRDLLQRLRSVVEPHERAIAWVLGVVAAVIVVVVSQGRMAASPDSVTYLSAAQSVLDGDGFGNWLENPLVTFPPLWPMAIVVVGITGLGVETSAMVLMALAVLVVPPLTHATLSHVTDSWEARTLGTLAVALTPVLVPWGYQGLSELPFTAVLLAATVLALHSAVAPGDPNDTAGDDTAGDDAAGPDASSAQRRNAALWGAVLVGAATPLIRYAGVAVPIAIAMWIALDTRRTKRWLTAAGALVVGFAPLGILTLVNSSNGEAFGSRLPSSLNPVQVLQQGLGAVGRTALWTLDQTPEAIAVLLGVALIALTVVVGLRTGESEPSGGRQARLLIALLALGQWGVMMVARAQAEINDLDGRLLAPTAVLVLVLAACLVGDLTHARAPLVRTAAVGIAVLWCAIGVLALGRNGLTAIDDLGYAGPEFVAARDLPALDEIPEECRELSQADVTDGDGLPDCGVLANEPWLWYRSEFRPLITPRTGDRMEPDLELLNDAVESGSDIYIAWTTVNEPYGYLMQIEDLEADYDLEEMGSADGITLYRVAGTA